MNVTGNVMTLRHFTDFYYLEALRAGISMAKSANPDNLFRRSFEKLEIDVNEAFDALSDTMAIRIWLYLWGAALGEAQYAGENCETEIEELQNFGYSETFDYFPTEYNIEMVKDVFGQYWASGGYGGEAWKSIVEGMELYGKISNAAFIDHAVDLEHNGGCVFDKTHASPFNLNCFSGYSSHNLKRFLDEKFSEDILNSEKYHEVSRKVYNLVTRYSNIVEKITAVEYLQPTLEWLTPFSIEWNSFDNTFTMVEADGGYHCAHCGDKIDCDYCVSINDQMYCDDCTSRCDNCGDAELTCYMEYIDGEHQDWCGGCVQEYKATCEGCNKDFHADNASATEDDYTLCNDCLDEYKCETCDEYHYNLPEHKHEEHDEELTETTQDTPSESGYKTTETSYAVVSKTVKLTNDNTVHMIVYETGNLFVFDLDKYYALSHSTKYDKAKYAIMTPCGLWFKHEAGTFQSAIQTANMAENILDWSTIKTVSDWQNVDNAAIAEIQALTKLEVK